MFCRAKSIYLMNYLVMFWRRHPDFYSKSLLPLAESNVFKKAIQVAAVVDLHRANSAKPTGTECYMILGLHKKPSEAPDMVRNCISSFPKVQNAGNIQKSFLVGPRVVQGSVALPSYGVGIMDLCLEKGKGVSPPPSCRMRWGRSPFLLCCFHIYVL